MDADGDFAHRERFSLTRRGGTRGIALHKDQRRDQGEGSRGARTTFRHWATSRVWRGVHHFAANPATSVARANQPPSANFSCAQKITGLEFIQVSGFKGVGVVGNAGVIFES
jgi:hypothetical protein